MTMLPNILPDQLAILMQRCGENIDSAIVYSDDDGTYRLAGYAARWEGLPRYFVKKFHNPKSPHIPIEIYDSLVAGWLVTLEARIEKGRAGRPAFNLFRKNVHTITGKIGAITQADIDKIFNPVRPSICIPVCAEIHL